MMVTVMPEQAEKERKKGGRGGRRGGHGVPHGGPRKWFKILKAFVKQKDVSAAEIHTMAEEAGFNVPIEFIEKKLDKLHMLSDDEGEEKKHEEKPKHQKKHCHKGPHGQGHGCHGFGGGMHGGFGGIFKNFMNMANMKKEDVQQMANNAGVEMPENAFEGMMKGDFSAMKNMDWSKFKGNCGNNQNWGKCGNGKGPMGYMKKRAHFVNGTDPEIVYYMTPGST